MTTVGLRANAKLVIVSMEVKWRWINMLPGLDAHLVSSMDRTH